MSTHSTFVPLSGLARLARVNGHVPLRLWAEGILVPAATLLVANNRRRPLFDPVKAVGVIRDAARSRLAPISPRELKTAIEAPIPGHFVTAQTPQA